MQAAKQSGTAMNLDDVQVYVKQIRKMAEDVYKTLGCGYGELIYKEALMVELRKASIPYEREGYVPILYKDLVIGTGKADIVVVPAQGLSIPIECKKTGIEEDAKQQLRTYMKGMGETCSHGILIQFPQPGPAQLEFRWARENPEGNLYFYRDDGGAWIFDENKPTKSKPKA
jgi:GxxExxY protein